MLSVVPTPIGNLKDISQRSIEALRAADFIICEDTRVTGRLLKWLDLTKPMVSNHSQNEHKVLNSLIERIKSGESAALVSDAGLPGLSDPGYLLIRACIQEDIPLTVLPGANAALTALIGSGIPCDRFYFQGFLPAKKGRQSRLKWLAELGETIILYESPHKLLKTLEQLIEHFGENLSACIARELSKMHEEYTRGSLKDLISDYRERPSVKGEIVIILDRKLNP
jgi:16S rRNA (cytidine1402-2'-O)-methyltransferase